MTAVSDELKFSPRQGLAELYERNIHGPPAHPPSPYPCSPYPCSPYPCSPKGRGCTRLSAVERGDTVPVSEDAATKHEGAGPSHLPVLPLKSTVVFPRIFIPLSVG